VAAAEGARLERLAVEVPDLTAWVAAFEEILGPGFERHRVHQRSGEIEIAIHPGGVELVAGDPERAPRLRSFHLCAPDLGTAAERARNLGWRHVDRVVLAGRAHEIFDADGLRIILIGPGPETGEALAARDD
jgi:hypothetical protein